MTIALDTTDGSGRTKAKSATLISSGSATATVTKPSDLASGEYLLAAVSAGASASSSISWTPPADFVEIISSTSNGASGESWLWVGYKKAGGSEPADYSFTATLVSGTGGRIVQAMLVRVTGADPSTFSDATAAALAYASSTAPDSGSVTTATDGAVVLSIVGGGDGRFLTADDSNGPSGYTVAYCRSSAVSSNDTITGIAYKTVATAGAENPGAWTGLTSSSVKWRSTTIAIKPAAPSGPTIADVNTDEALSPGESITITGSNFGASQGAGGVAITQESGAVSSAVTITGWSDTSITGTVNLGGLSYGATTSLVVTDNAAATGNIAVTFVPATGYSYVTLSGYPHATAYVVGDGASPALVDGDQVEYESTASSGAGVTVNADGSFVLDTTDPGHFQYRVRDDTDNTWSDWETIYVNEAAPSELVGAAPTRWWLQTPKRKRKYPGRLM